MSSLQQQRTIKQEGTDLIEDLPSVKKYVCKEKCLLNNFSFCKDIENPDDRLGADPTTVKKEEIENLELVGEQVTSEPRFDIKDEEVEFTETTVTVYGQSTNAPKAETPEEVFPCRKYGNASAQSMHLKERVEICNPEKQYKCNICAVVSVAEGPQTYEAPTLVAPATPVSVAGSSPPMVVSPHVEGSSEVGLIKTLSVIENKLLQPSFDVRPSTSSAVGTGSVTSTSTMIRRCTPPSTALQHASTLNADVWHRPHMQQCIAGMKADFLGRNEASYRHVVSLMESNIRSYNSFLLYLKHLKDAEVAASFNCCLRDLDDLIDTVERDYNVLRTALENVMQLLKK